MSNLKQIVPIINIDQLKLCVENAEDILNKLKTITFNMNNEKLEDLQQEVYILKNNINTFVKTHFKLDDSGDE